MRLSKILLGAAAALAFTVTAANAQVVVSSKIDTEGGVLGNIIKQVLEANGIAVTDKIQLGGTPIVREAITAGEIDIYPEYTGNAAFFFDKADDPLWNDAAKAYAEAAKLDYEANKIVWLTPAPANNTWAVAVRNDVAEANNLKTFTDSAPGSPAAARSSSRPRPSSSTRRRRCRSSRKSMASRSRPTSWSRSRAATPRRPSRPPRSRPTASMPPWSMAPTAASPPRASSCSKTTRACSRSIEPAPIIREEVLDRISADRRTAQAGVRSSTSKRCRTSTAASRSAAKPAAAVATDFLTRLAS